MFSNHYIDETLWPAKLTEFANWAADTIRKTQGTKSPILMFSGLSGTTLATAASLSYYQKYQEQCSMVYWRKEKEERHSDRKANIFAAQGRSHSGVFSEGEHQLYFVDDFISGGNTLERCSLGFSTMKDGSSRRLEELVDNLIILVAVSYEHATKDLEDYPVYARRHISDFL